MPRGQTAKVGDVMVNANGYHNTRTHNGWELTHRLVAAKKLGRNLRPNEQVRFQDGDRTNLEPDNIEVITMGQTSIRKRLAVVADRIRELEAEREELLAKLKAEEGK